MPRNLTIAERHDCLTPAGLHDMRRGQAATITRGPYTGDQLSVDHIIPFWVPPAWTAERRRKPRVRSCRHDPEGDTGVRREGVNVIANLELMLLRLNIGKRNRLGERQQALWRRLRSAGLLRE